MSAELAQHPRDAEAAEYVIGTLPFAEREAFERDMASEPALVRLVRSWEERLAPLTGPIPSVEPPPSLWAAILTALGPAARQGVAPAAANGDAAVLPWPISSEVVRLRRSRSLWRGATIAAGSLAAALALFIASERGLPGLPAPGASGLVAVVNRSGELPALIVRVDPGAGTVQVRAIAAETPADRSLELWSIVGTDPPRSLGVVTSGLARVPIPATHRARLDGATLAVTVEPPGGSPTGGPTGNIVYQGKLVPEAP